MSYFLKNAVTASNQREIRKINMHIRAITSMTSQKKKNLKQGCVVVVRAQQDECCHSCHS